MRFLKPPSLLEIEEKKKVGTSLTYGVHFKVTGNQICWKLAQKTRQEK